MGVIQEPATRTTLAPAPRLLWPLAIANLIANIGIVITGGAVRLTGSGLGCPTWPRCTEESYTPHGALGINGAIEFGNRMLTFVLAIVAICCWVAALVWLRRSGSARPVKRTFWMTTVIACSIPAQAVLGGITVLTDLNPYVVGLHLLVSMAIIGVCVWLLDTLRGRPRDGAAAGLRRLSLVIFAVTWVVLWLGTVVTGSGPHSGDAESRRTGLDPQVMSHVHAASVYLLLALTLGAIVAARRIGDTHVAATATLLLVIELAQGVIGFVQYWTDLPIVLVGLHMLGAAAISAGATRLLLAPLPRTPLLAT